MARQQRGIRTRRTILEAAGAVFDEHGYSSTTIAMVLERADVTKGALYFHFPSKESLARAVLAERPPLEAVPARPCKLQEMVDVTFVLARRLLDDPLLKGGVRLAVDQCAPQSVDHAGLFRRWADHLLWLLRQAHEQGELLPSVNPRETVEMLVGSLAGIQLMSRALTDRADLAHRISVLWSHVLPSIAVPGLLPRIDTAADRGSRITNGLDRPGT
ncbi:ScbR family autoregulator-binding transcription factor [Streptomyces griseoviridis]|uniref:ScbR family autoregulator-binding transcription factor n=1 Tax=Streptomyces griseoviridis TaxID=45398 RepID=UPI00344147FC